MNTTELERAIHQWRGGWFRRASPIDAIKFCPRNRCLWRPATEDDEVRLRRFLETRGHRPSEIELGAAIRRASLRRG